MSEKQNEQCPVCETELVSYSSPVVLWCEGCQKEYWQEDKNWFTAGPEGIARILDTEAL